MTSNKSTVFVIDDEEAIREAVRWLMESIHLPTECFSSAEAFLEKYQATQAGCLVLDNNLPELSGLELLQQIKQGEKPFALPVIMMTGQGDIATAVNAMKSGAFDFIEKPLNEKLLLDRVKQAVAYDTEIRRELNERDSVMKKVNTLTPREHQVMLKLVEGKSSKVIARELDISHKTVEIHRGRIMEKMDAASVVELVRMIIGTGIVTINQ
ncbi:response regulator transcription factor [Beggiatoa leptomitoformis]|uniref:Response regulator n=1 Tax=Beggiatoa leptomitoformis TaxID=288004 RepID=A0A2N9YB88_9GAMM|nr:response regulator [Beggiatoa leptomitoformis]ALG66961.1 response regulator [Beggiatoa leptomitoformis]AUI67669.1 response regulator [Beggiatoa leptomitoformis]